MDHIQRDTKGEDSDKIKRTMKSLYTVTKEPTSSPCNPTILPDFIILAQL